MSDVVRSIRDSIKTQMGTTLGSGYSELAFVSDVQKNPFNKQSKGYGITVGSTEQIDGVNRYLTFDQEYNIVLTEFYGKTNIGDSELEEKHLDLIQNINSIFLDLVETRAGGSSSAMNVKDLSIEEIEILETEKVIVVRATFTVTYRNYLGS